MDFLSDLLRNRLPNCPYLMLNHGSIRSQYGKDSFEINMILQVRGSNAWIAL